MQNQIPKNWQKVKLGNVSILITKGTTPTTIGGKFTSDGVNFIKVESITEDGKFIRGKFDHIDQEANDKLLKRSIISKNDLLYSIAGAIGRVALVTEAELPANTNQALAIIRPDTSKVNPKYLFYVLSTPYQKRFANNMVAQSVQANINLQQVGDFDLELPLLNEQTKIASILSAFDDKIEANNKIAKTLEQMTQALFKEWFVNFKFPGYEKAEFVETEVGNIPKGWKAKKIKEITKVNKGLSYSSAEIRGKLQGLPMINLANFLRGGGFNPEGIKFYSGKYTQSHVVKPGDIVIAMTDLTSNREVIGHPARVPAYTHWDKVLISLDVCSIEAEELYIEFLYYLMLRKDFSYTMASSAGGTNVSHLSKSMIEDYSFVLPEKDFVKRFQDFVKPIFSQINQMEQENQKLATLRDLLLPKLMKGEIRV